MSEAITRDLMRKVESDVYAAIARVVSLTDKPLPVAMSGTCSALGFLAGTLNALADNPVGEDVDPDLVFLAAFIAARMGTGHPDAVNQAYADLKAFRAGEGS